jgi:ubiquinol-cytochrome c reductase iron-sulfur subunit
MGSLEVDLAPVEEGSTMTVKWRGKPVFIKHRTDDEIAVQAATPLNALVDPQTDAERTINPKVRH